MLSIKKVAAGLALGAFLTAIIIGQHREIQRITSERDLYACNTKALLTGIEILKKDSSNQAYQIKALSLSKKEYEAYRAEDAQTIKDLKKKLKNLQSAGKQVLEVKVPIYVPVEKEPEGVQTVRLENEHISFVGVIKNDSLNADITIPVELKQYIVKIPKHKFLWWSWGCKGFNQIIHTDNPYINLKYSEFIEIR